MVPEKGSKGNLDPSRFCVGGIGTRSGGSDDPGVLPGCAGSGRWRGGVAGGGLGCGRPGCSSGVHDRSADRSRRPSGSRNKLADGEPLRHDRPLRASGETGQRRRFMAPLEASSDGDLRGCQRGPCRVTAGSSFHPAFDKATPFPDKGLTIDGRVSPAVTILACYAGWGYRKPRFHGIIDTVRTRHPVHLDVHGGFERAPRQIPYRPFVAVVGLLQFAPTARAFQLAVATLAPHPQFQDLVLLIDLVLVDPVARPLKNTGELVVSRQLPSLNHKTHF